MIFLTDNSFNLKEHEAVHPVDSKIHSENVNKQVNDWCYNNPPTNSDLKDLIMDQTNNIGKLIEVENFHSTNIIKHQKVLDEMLITQKLNQELLKQLIETIDKFNNK